MNQLPTPDPDTRRIEPSGQAPVAPASKLLLNRLLSVLAILVVLGLVIGRIIGNPGAAADLAVTRFEQQVAMLELQMEHLRFPAMTYRIDAVSDSTLADQDMRLQWETIELNDFDAVCQTLDRLGWIANNPPDIAAPTLDSVPFLGFHSSYAGATEAQTEISTRVEQSINTLDDLDSELRDARPLCMWIQEVVDSHALGNSSPQPIATGSVMQLPAGAVTCTDRLGCPEGFFTAMEYGLLAEGHATIADAFDSGCGAELAEACALAADAFHQLTDDDYAVADAFSSAMADSAGPAAAQALQTALDGRESRFTTLWDAAQESAQSETGASSLEAAMLDSLTAKFDEIARLEALVDVRA